MSTRGRLVSGYRNPDIKGALSISGGTIYQDASFNYHKFSATGSFYTHKEVIVDLVLVAGGGGSATGGQFYVNGGGGSGGVLALTQVKLPVGSWAVTVGAGGPATRAAGSDTTIVGPLIFTATGGGRPGGNGTTNAGGSGGGGDGNAGATGGNGVISQGSTGGSGSGGYGGGGGGGAGAVGSPSTRTSPLVNEFGGAGGAGVLLTDWCSTTSSGASNYLGGGGGGAGSKYYGGTNGFGAGGAGGGGAGGFGTAGTSGTANTGGGGGGGSGDGTNTFAGGAGGSGLVLIRYRRTTQDPKWPTVTNGYDSTILADSPIAYYPMNERFGTTTVDSTSNQRHLLYTGSPTLNQTGASANLPQSVLFGTSKMAYGTFSGNFIVPASGSWSIETWFKYTDGTALYALLRWQDAAGTGTTFTGGLTLNSDASFGVSAGSIVGITYTSSATFGTTAWAGSLNDGAWHHAVVTATSGGNMLMYIDGVLRGTYSGSRNTTATGNRGPHIGGYWTGTAANCLPGNISNTAYYNYALTQAQVSAHYDAASVVSGGYWTAQVPTGVIASGLILHLDAGNPNSYPGTGTVWYDLSGSGNNFNIATASAYNSTGAKYMDFNGTYGCAKNASDISLTGTVTYVVWTRIKNSSTDWRTLTRGYSAGGGDHQVIVQSGGWSMGYFDNPTNGFQNSSYSQQSLPGYGTTQWVCLYFRFNTSSPYWYMSYNDTPGTTRASLTSTNAQYAGGFGTLGGYGTTTDPAAASNSQYWGDIGYFSVYNRVLSDSELSQIYEATRSRFGL